MPAALPTVMPCLQPTPADGKGEDVGAALYAFAAELYPLPRCLTGEGLRETLRRIGARIPLAVNEVPTGTPVLDWTIPKEWRLRAAWIATLDGRRLADAADSPLHVVQYSRPVRARMTLADLRPHLHTLPDHPDWTPYRTSYYADAWGFCLPHRTLEALEAAGDGLPLDVCINAEHVDGALSYGECVLPGETDDEVLISAHACHPALANDNASALAVATFLAERLAARPRRRLTWRFLFAPGTLGAVAWLAQNPDAARRIRHGLVLANLGDAGGFTYKQTRRGTLTAQPLTIDRAVALALREEGVEVRPFDPFGYDERQFGSPGFDLPVGRLTRTPHGEYPEYHTSADDLSLISPEALAGSLDALLRIADVLEGDGRYRSTEPFGEPMLGRRGLYRNAGGAVDTPETQRALLWVLNLADGQHTLLDVAERSGLPFEAIRTAADRLFEHGLLEDA